MSGVAARGREPLRRPSQRDGQHHRVRGSEFIWAWTGDPPSAKKRPIRLWLPTKVNVAWDGVIRPIPGWCFLVVVLYGKVRFPTRARRMTFGTRKKSVYPGLWNTSALKKAASLPLCSRVGSVSASINQQHRNDNTILRADPEDPPSGMDRTTSRGKLRPDTQNCPLRGLPTRTHVAGVAELCNRSRRELITAYHTFAGTGSFSKPTAGARPPSVVYKWGAPSPTKNTSGVARPARSGNPHVLLGRSQCRFRSPRTLKALVDWD